MNPSEVLLSVRELLSDSYDSCAAECLAEIESGEIVLSAMGESEASYVARIYKRRWDIQRKVTLSNAVSGYEQVVPKLEAHPGRVSIVAVAASNATYIIFSASDNRLLGILRSMASDIEKLAELHIKWRQSSLESSGARFIRGKLIERK